MPILRLKTCLTLTVHCSLPGSSPIIAHRCFRFWRDRRVPSDQARQNRSAGVMVFLHARTLVGAAGSDDYRFFMDVTPWAAAGVLWILGWSMVSMALLVRLPIRWIGIFGVG